MSFPGMKETNMFLAGSRPARLHGRGSRGEIRQ